MIEVAPLTDSTPLLGDDEALRQRWDDEGALYFRGIMDPKLMAWGEQLYREELVKEGLIDPANPVPVLIAEIYPTSIRASGLAICASAPLTLGFAVFPTVVPMAISSVGWEAGLSLVVVPLLLASTVAALFLPNRRSGLPVS